MQFRFDRTLLHVQKLYAHSFIRWMCADYYTLWKRTWILMKSFFCWRYRSFFLVRLIFAIRFEKILYFFSPLCVCKFFAWSIGTAYTHVEAVVVVVIFTAVAVVWHVILYSTRRYTRRSIHTNCMRETLTYRCRCFRRRGEKNYNNLLNLRFDEWREKKVNHVSTKKTRPKKYDIFYRMADFR